MISIRTLVTRFDISDYDWNVLDNPVPKDRGLNLHMPTLRAG
jgi:hypothetical protein